MTTEAPACRALLNQAKTKWPNRSTLSDGILASRKHTQQNPYSDHELGNAVDLTNDPEHGCDAHAFVRWLVKQHNLRVKYAISMDQIWSVERADEGWRPYNQNDPSRNRHEHHAHISIYHVYRNDTSNWFEGYLEEFIMASKAEVQAMLDQSEAQIMAAVRKEIQKAVLTITGGVRQRDAQGKVIDPDKGNVSLADVLTKVEEDDK